MLIDYAKSYFVFFLPGHSFESFCNCQSLKIKTFVDSNGEIIKEIAKFQGGHITKHASGNIELGLGFPAVMYGSNVQDLTYRETVSIIEAIEANGIDIKRTSLNSIEIGATIKTPWEPGIYIDSIVVWGKSEPRRFKRKDAHYCQLDKSEISLKIYDKGKQWGLNGNYQRYELKVRKMRYLQKFNIKTFSDLKQWSNIETLTNHLLRTFKDLIVLDEIDNSQLTKPQIKLLEKGSNTRFWLCSELSRSTNIRNRSKFQSLISAYGKNGFNKLSCLLVSHIKKHATISPTFESNQNEKTCNDITTFLDIPKSQKVQQYHRYILGDNKHSNGKNKSNENPIDLHTFFEPYIKGIKTVKTPFCFSGVTVGNLPFFLSHELSLLDGKSFRYDRLLKLKQYLQTA